MRPLYAAHSYRQQVRTPALLVQEAAMRTKWGEESPPPQDLASCSERVSPVPDLLELAGLAGQTSQYSELLFVQERVVNAYHCAWQ